MLTPEPGRPSAHPRPAGWPLMRMQWRQLLFIHWRVDPSLLRPLIPEPLELDLYDGSAWVGLVPFTMRDVLPAIIPPLPGVSDIPALSAFHECNVRTYVSCKGEAGVWFFSLDAASRLAVWTARRLFHLPYFYARIALGRRLDEIHYVVDRRDHPRAVMRCAWRPGEALPQSRPGELAHFLTERLMLYSTNRKGELFRCRIHHEPWPLRRAELLFLQDGLVKAAGIEIDDSEPPATLHHVDELDVQAWPLERA